LLTDKTQTTEKMLAIFSVANRMFKTRPISIIMEQKEKCFKIPKWLLRRNYLKSGLGWNVVLRSASDALRRGPGFPNSLIFRKGT
jgi:hypothetical protein